MTYMNALAREEALTEGFVQAVTTDEGIRRCQDILIEVWDLERGGHRNIIPTRLFQISQEYGGTLLAAYAEDQMVGFAWGVLALDEHKRVFLYSDTLAVLPRFRDRGIGRALKLAQRQWALQSNLTMVRWTYDPMEARNGYLNIARLGGIVNKYKPNAYGVGVTGPNKGIETDRFVVDWHIASLRAQQSCAVREPTSPPNLKSSIALGSWRTHSIPTEVRLEIEDESFLLPVPLDFQKLKVESSDMAKRWRLAARTVCQTYFARRYSVVDYHVDVSGGQRQGYYRLSSEWPCDLDHAESAAHKRDSRQ